MKYIIDPKECEKLNVSFPVALYLLALYYNTEITKESQKESICRGLASISSYDRNGNPEIHITQTGVDFVESIFLNSEFREDKKIDRFDELAKKLKELFPKGKKPGTSLMWRGSDFEVSKKLKTLIKKTGAEFTDEQAIEATRKYVESFNGIYNYMQILPYFIIKQVPVNGVYEERSQLLSYIENEGQIESNNDWTAELR